MSIDPHAFAVHVASPRGFQQAYIYEKAPSQSAPALVCVHGWPETKRIFWKVIKPFQELGFDVIVPDLRGFGDSDLAPDGFYDVVSHAHDLYALVHDHLKYDSVVLLGGDLGGPVIQELALRYPNWVDRMVLFNSPLPYNKERMGHLNTRASRESADYYFRQGTDADSLAAELRSTDERRRYIATFYSSRFWAHPSSFNQEEIDFHTEPFADAVRLRATFGNYESAFSETKRSEKSKFGQNDHTPTMILFGTSDHVMYPDFDLMAATVFKNHVGPFLLRDCGHFVPWEAPHQLVSGTAAFCADLLKKS
jgi:pimeloyl-ACP methyl ester carboxylesterase